MAKFQVKLSGSWHDYDGEEDKILKRAFLAGFPNARFALRGQHYEYDFKQMEQKNLDTGKSRDIRAPYKWTQPAEPLVPKGRTTTVTVPKTPDGKVPSSIQLPHPDRPGSFFLVTVPPTAKPGQVLLVPIPDLPADLPPVETPAAPAEAFGGLQEMPTSATAKKDSGSWSTGAKVAAGLGGLALVGGLAAGGVILGEHISDVGWDAFTGEVGSAADAAGDAISGAATDAGHAIADVAGDAGTWIAGAADHTGDFIMDLF